MTFFSFLVWSTLLIIGVSDAKAHRIPNKILLLLLMLLCLSTLIQTPQQVLWSVFLDEFTAFAIAFAFALVLHLLKVMAPGDVKFIAVLGFFLGTNELVSYLYYVGLITALVGPMYWLLNRLHMPLKTVHGFGRMSFTDLQVRNQDVKSEIVKGKDLVYMPFAPILVMGLALHQYYT